MPKSGLPGQEEMLRATEVIELLTGALLDAPMGRPTSRFLVSA